jgi:hypothetical protein
MDKQEITKDFTFAKLSDLNLPVTFRMFVRDSSPLDLRARWLKSELFLKSESKEPSWKDIGRNLLLLKSLITRRFVSLESNPSSSICADRQQHIVPHVILVSAPRQTFM